MSEGRDDNREGHRLDPSEWDAFGESMHRVLDSCLERMRSYRDLPWQPPNLADLQVPNKPNPDVYKRLVEDIMPTATGNTHPAFWGWVHGAGIPSCLAADMVASTMNSNCGGRDHGATHVEKACIDFLCQTAGFSSGGGVLTTGTSQATVLALCAARNRLVPECQTRGIYGHQFRVYTAAGAHSCIPSALKIMGHGSDSVKQIPVDGEGKMQLSVLKEAMEEDKQSNILPLAVVGTAGTVGTGCYDDLLAIGRFCKEKQVWFHVDSAFGYWSRLADSPWKDLCNGVELADSIGLDAHKWPGVQYSCAACLVADPNTLRDCFSGRATYLQSHESGLAGGDLWYTDYSMDLSRDFRALKLWTALQESGSDTIGKVITDNCKQAAYMGELVESSPYLQLEHKVVSNVCIFSVKHGEVGAIAAELQREGKGVFSTITAPNGASCLRAAIVNHRTTCEVVKRAIEEVESIQKRLELSA